MMTFLDNSGQQTKGKVLRKRISSRRVNRRERVLSSSQVITGTPPPPTPHSLPSNSPAHQPHRSLVTTLRAAEKFEQSHLSTPEVSRLINGAKFFYVEGYFLTHGLESALEVAKKASETGKVDPRLPFSGTRAVHHAHISRRFSPLICPLLSSLNSSKFNSSKSSLIVTLSSVTRARPQHGLAPLGYPTKMISPPSPSRLQRFPSQTPRALAQSSLLRAPSQQSSLRQRSRTSQKSSPSPAWRMDKLSIPTALATRLPAVSWVHLWLVNPWMRLSLPDIN